MKSAPTLFQVKLNPLVVAVSLALASLSTEALSATTIQNTTTNSGATGIALDASSTPTDVNGTSSGLTGTGGTGYTTDTRSATTPVSLVDTNGVNNSGTLVNSASNNTNGIAGIDLSSDNTATATAYARDYETGVAAISASASTSATATSNSTVSNNTVNNSGSITANKGIQLRSTSSASASATAVADAWANNDGNSTGENPTATATAVATATANSLVSSNVITNSGTITARDLGISLLSVSNASDAASATRILEVGNNSGADVHYSSSTVAGTATSSSTTTSYITGNTVSNSGTVVVTAGTGVSLLSQAGITSTVDSATATVNTNTINNSGVIAASGASSDGIYLNAQANGTADVALINGNTINNTGRVYAGRNAISLTASELNTSNATVSQNTITNPYDARIVAGNIGVYINAVNVNRNTITSSGLIVSDPGMSLSGTALTKSSPSTWNPTATGSGQAIAIEIDATGVTSAGQQNNLNLNAPAYLAGRILLDTDSKTNVNLTSGISHSVRWAFQHASGYIQTNQASAYNWTGGSTTWASLSGTVPWFVNQQTADVNGIVNDVYATIDPSAFAAAPNQLADLSNMVSTVSREGLAKNTTATDGFWLSAQGGVMNYDGNYSSTMKQDNNLYSVALGYNRTVLDDYRVGLVVGYSDASFDTGSFYKDLYGHSYNNKAKGGYLGARAATKVGPFDVDAGLSAGFQNHDDKRFVNDNLVWWGESTATSSYNSYWFSPEVGLSLPIPAVAGFTVSPNVRLTYSGQHIDGYTESGTNSNATIDSRYIGVFEGKVGINIANTFGPVDVSADIGYMGRSLVGDDKVRVTMIGDVHDVSFYYRDVNAGYLKAKANLNINDNVEASVAASYTNGTNVEGGNVIGAIKVKF